MPPITDVVKNLLIINVLMFIGTTNLSPEIQSMLSLHYLYSEFNPYQLVTHMFMHANFNHLLFNMLTLYFMGPSVEARMGSKRFLFYYLFVGLGAAGLHLAVHHWSVLQNGMLFDTQMLGASGAVYGVMAAFAMFFPNQQLMLMFPPIPIAAKYLVVGLVVIDLFSGLSGHRTGIAHFAHIGGAFFGVLLILYWRKFQHWM